MTIVRSVVLRAPRLLLCLGIAALAAADAPAGAQDWRGPVALQVQVDDTRGRALAGAEVRLVYLAPAGGGALPPITSDASGKVNVGGLAAGRWMLEVRHATHMTYRAEIAISADNRPAVLSAAQEMVPGATGTLRVKLSRGKGGAPPPVSSATFAPVTPLPPPATPAPAAPAPAPAVAAKPAQAPAVTPPPISPPQVAQQPVAPPPAAAPAVAAAKPAPAPTPTAPAPAVAPPAAKPAPVPGATPAATPPAVSKPAPSPSAPAPAPAIAKPAPVTPSAPPAAGPSPVAPATPPSTTAKPSPPPPAAAPAPAPTPTPPPPAAPKPAPSPSAPAPAVTSAPPAAASAPAPAAAPVPAPVAAPSPAAPSPVAASSPAAPAEPRRARLCVECKPGENAEWGEARIDTGAATGCPADLRQRLEVVPLYGGAELAALDATLGGSCRVIRLDLPEGARFTGFRYEASGGNVSADCLPERACPAGGARFPFPPVIRKEGGRTILLVGFESTAPEPRSALVAGYYSFTRK